MIEIKQEVKQPSAVQALLDKLRSIESFLSYMSGRIDDIEREFGKPIPFYKIQWMPNLVIKIEKHNDDLVIYSLFWDKYLIPLNNIDAKEWTERSSDTTGWD